MSTSLDTLRRRARTILLEPYVLVTPGSPLVSPQGTPGTSSVGYVITALNATGESNGSQAGVSTTSAATLSGVNFNRLTWTAVPGAASYNIRRSASPTSPASVGLIGNTTSTTFDDTGIAGDGSIAPTINTSGLLSPFWNDDDLLSTLIDGCHDLWRAIIDLHKNHFATEDETNMSLAVSATSITGVPADCFRVLNIEPRDITSTGAYRNVIFRPKPFQSDKWQTKRSLGTISPNDSEFFYDILNAGSPVAAPTIKVVPASSSAILLRVLYVHTLPALVETSDNPIPGESDNALIAWTVAYARALETKNRMPDANWLGIYATDKQALLTALTPRQEQEVEVVEDFFGTEMGGY
jgi:hypothetical protein